MLKNWNPRLMPLSQDHKPNIYGENPVTHYIKSDFLIIVSDVYQQIA